MGFSSLYHLYLARPRYPLPLFLLTPLSSRPSILSPCLISACLGLLSLCHLHHLAVHLGFVCWDFLFFSFLFTPLLICFVLFLYTAAVLVCLYGDSPLLFFFSHSCLPFVPCNPVCASCFTQPSCFSSFCERLDAHASTVCVPYFGFKFLASLHPLCFPLLHIFLIRQEISHVTYSPDLTKRIDSSHRNAHCTYIIGSWLAFSTRTHRILLSSSSLSSHLANCHQSPYASSVLFSPCCFCDHIAQLPSNRFLTFFFLRVSSTI